MRASLYYYCLNVEININLLRISAWLWSSSVELLFYTGEVRRSLFIGSVPLYVHEYKLYIMDYKMQPPTLSRKHDNLVLRYMFWVIKNSLTWQIRTRANHQSTKAIACYAKEQVTRHFRSTCMATQWPIWYIVQVKIKFNIYLLEGYTFYLALILVIMFATYVATVKICFFSQHALHFSDNSGG